MKKKHRTIWAVAVSMGVVTGAMSLAKARAELVYENDAQLSHPNVVRVEDRAQLRQALGASERAQATLQAQAPAAPVQQQSPVQQVTVQAVPVAQAIPVAQAAPITQVEVGPARVEAPVEHVSKGEMMRRERVRAELRNEDILQERLEELRLREERRRTDSLLTGLPIGADASASAAAAAGGAVAAASAAAAAPVLREQIVVAPVTEHPGQPSLVPASAAAASAVAAPVAAVGTSVAAVTVGPNSAATVENTSTAVSVAISDASDRTLISVIPRGGLTDMVSGTGFTVNPRYSAGVALSAASSENLSFEIGYQFSELGVSMGTGYGYGLPIYAGMPGYGGSTENLAIKQNVADLGLKIHVLGPSAKIRPFLGGGAGYAKSYINYDSSILSTVNKDPGLAAYSVDQELDQYLGYLTTGLDIRLSKSISVGVVGKYYKVLSAREKTGVSNLNGASTYYPNAAYPYGYGAYTGYGANPTPATEKQVVSNALAKTGFYSILAGVTFTF